MVVEDQDQVPYHVCHRCALIVMQGGGYDTALLCQDCWDEDKIEVRMKFVPISVIHESPTQLG